MGSWNTLHLFNDAYFYSELVPRLREDRSFVEDYFTSDGGRLILFDNKSNRDQRIHNLISLFRQSDESFKSHSGFTGFHHQNEKELFPAEKDIAIGDLNHILTWIIFSECALFNPHFRLGYRLLTHYIDPDSKDSIASECLENMQHPEFGSLYNNEVFNWLTADECRLLFMDFEKIELNSKHPDAAGYLSDLKKFIEVAVTNQLGLITGIDMNEQALKTTGHHYLRHNIDWKALESENIIWY